MWCRLFDVAWLTDCGRGAENAENNQHSEMAIAEISGSKR